MEKILSALSAVGIVEYWSFYCVTCHFTALSKIF